MPVRWQYFPPGFSRAGFCIDNAAAARLYKRLRHSSTSPAICCWSSVPAPAAPIHAAIGLAIRARCRSAQAETASRAIPNAVSSAWAASRP